WSGVKAAWALSYLPADKPEFDSLVKKLAKQDQTLVRLVALAMHAWTLDSPLLNAALRSAPGTPQRQFAEARKLVLTQEAKEQKEKAAREAAAALPPVTPPPPAPTPSNPASPPASPAPVAPQAPPAGSPALPKPPATSASW